MKSTISTCPDHLKGKRITNPKLKRKYLDILKGRKLETKYEYSILLDQRVKLKLCYRSKFILDHVTNDNKLGL